MKLRRPMPRLRYTVGILLSGCLSITASFASDVTLRTDHDHYPGEGAFQTVEGCVEFATRGKTSSQDKAIAMYNWFLTHQWHLMSPMEWFVPGRVPDTADPGNYETVVFDANRARFSYGYGLCGTVHAWNETYWKAMGFAARRREFPNHINSEIQYDGAWHAFDTDMAGLVFRPDGVVAGYDDIQKNPSLVDKRNYPLPHYPFAWPSDFKTMKAGWQEVAKRKKWYRLYNGGYATHPGIVDLRPGESFTRWYDRDHFGGINKRRFWQNHKDGPFRQWTYFGNGTPFHKEGEANARGKASYCNVEFIYEPPLHKDTWREGISHLTKNVGQRSASPKLHSMDGKTASVTFRHFSPYVICGDPVDDKNPMSAEATDGLVMTGNSVGIVKCEVSADEGQTWAKVPLQPEEFQVDFTEFVKGRYGWQVRFSWSEDSGLDALKFTTTTQVCQSMYPHLTPNGCDVEYRSAPRRVVAVLPNFGQPEEAVDAFEERSLRSMNLEYKPRSRQSRYAYQATDRNPASVVFKVMAPTKLTEVRAAVRYQVPVPPPPGCSFQLQLSTDKGKSWKEFAVADIPSDNEFSSGWLSGNADVSSNNTNNALVKFVMHTPGRRAAVIDAQLYGIHETPRSPIVAVNYGWIENKKLKTHSTRIEPNAKSARFRVPTGDNIMDSFVQIHSLP